MFSEENAQKLGLQGAELMHPGRGYGPEVTSLVFSGRHQNQPVIMKVMPQNLASRREVRNLFGALHGLESDTVCVPSVRAAGEMEGLVYMVLDHVNGSRLFPNSLPERQSRVKPDPMTSVEEKKRALGAYQAYRNAWSQMTPFIPEPEGLNAARFTQERVNRWYQGAIGMDPLLFPKDIFDRCQEFLPWLLEAFKDVPMEFQHGHFFNENLILDGEKLYLLDFGRCGWYPASYDLAMMLWNLSFHSCLEAHIQPAQWLGEMKLWEIAMYESEFSLDDISVFRTNMAERAFGTLLADLGQNVNRSALERDWMANIWTELFRHYIYALPGK